MSHQRAPDDIRKPLRAPCRLLRDLDHNTVTRKQRADHGSDEVMERVIPAHKSSNHAQRLVVHRVLLIRHQQVRRPPLRAQRLLAVLDRPLQLLGRDQDLAQLGVHHGLAAVEAGHPADLLLVVEHVLEQGAEHGAALAEGGLGPVGLGGVGLVDGAVDALGGRRVDEAEELAGGGRVALDRRGARDLDGGVLKDLLFLGEVGGRDGVADRTVFAAGDVPDGQRGEGGPDESPCWFGDVASYSVVPCLSVNFGHGLEYVREGHRQSVCMHIRCILESGLELYEQTPWYFRRHSCVE